MTIINARKKAELIDSLEKEFLITHSGLENFDNNKNIFIKKINHDYGDTQVNLNLDLNIDKTGIYGIPAVSGTGKTTLFKIISGLIFSPYSDIYIGQKDLRNIDTDFLNERIIYLSDKSFLFKGSLKENIGLTEKSKLNSEALDLLFDKSEKLLPESFIDTEGKNFLLGQRQRIILLRLLSLKEKPGIIILDEALSGIDEQREKTILKYLQDFYPSSKIFFITHRQASLDYCDFKLNF